MDIFDQYIYEELISEYERSNLTDDDYEELYTRFSNLHHLDEVKPYLLVMRYLGLGTIPKPDDVLTELKEVMDNSVELEGLYYDLKLCTNPENTDAIVELRRLIELGYKGTYLKDKSNINLVEITPNEEEQQNTSESIVEDDVVDNTLHYQGMSFESNGHSGYFFTSGDIDYLNARIFFDPIKATRKVSICSQIFIGNSIFSDSFADEITLNPGDTWVTTTGWGNNDCTCYAPGLYRWDLTIDQYTFRSQEFRVYSGKIDEYGIPVKDVKLFASKASGALETDWNNYTATFDSTTLEHVYFKLLFDPLGQEKNFQVFIKIDNLEDGTEFYNNYALFHIESNWDNSWTSVGFNSSGNWKKGLYKYTLKIGSGSIFEGVFTVC